ncbi:Period3 circadian clock protein, putative, partial [Trichomonas vaginalis G3]
MTISISPLQSITEEDLISFAEKHVGDFKYNGIVSVDLETGSQGISIGYLNFIDEKYCKHAFDKIRDRKIKGQLPDYSICQNPILNVGILAGPDMNIDQNNNQNGEIQNSDSKLNKRDHEKRSSYRSSDGSRRHHHRHHRHHRRHHHRHTKDSYSSDSGSQPSSDSESDYYSEQSDSRKSNENS